MAENKNKWVQSYTSETLYLEFLSIIVNWHTARELKQEVSGYKITLSFNPIRRKQPVSESPDAKLTALRFARNQLETMLKNVNNALENELKAQNKDGN